jgi:hypothetical protein
MQLDFIRGILSWSFPLPFFALPPSPLQSPTGACKVDGQLLFILNKFGLAFTLQMIQSE